MWNVKDSYVHLWSVYFKFTKTFIILNMFVRTLWERTCARTYVSKKMLYALAILERGILCMKEDSEIEYHDINRIDMLANWLDRLSLSLSIVRANTWINHFIACRIYTFSCIPGTALEIYQFITHKYYAASKNLTLLWNWSPIMHIIDLRNNNDYLKQINSRSWVIYACRYTRKLYTVSINCHPRDSWKRKCCDNFLVDIRIQLNVSQHAMTTEATERWYCFDFLKFHDGATSLISFYSAM
jgi:hypothetical protein